MVINEAEAAVIRQAAADLLARDQPQGRHPRPARAAPVLTVTGARWNTRTLTGALLKPAVAGLTPGQAPGARQEDTRPLVPAPWPAILHRARVGAAESQADRPGPADHRSGQRAAVAGDRVRHVRGVRRAAAVGGAGNGRPPAYVGRDCGHIRREAARSISWSARP